MAKKDRIDFVDEDGFHRGNRGHDGVWVDRHLTVTIPHKNLSDVFDGKSRVLEFAKNCEDKVVVKLVPAGSSVQINLKGEFNNVGLLDDLAAKVSRVETRLTFSSEGLKITTVGDISGKVFKELGMNADVMGPSIETAIAEIQKLDPTGNFFVKHLKGVFNLFRKGFFYTYKDVKAVTESPEGLPDVKIRCAKCGI